MIVLSISVRPSNYQKCIAVIDRRIIVEGVYFLLIEEGFKIMINEKSLLIIDQKIEELNKLDSTKTVV